MPIPSLPLALSPLAAVGRKKVQPERSASVEGLEDEDNEDDSDLAATTAAAALYTHRYSGICVEHDSVVAKLHKIEKLTSPLLPDMQPSSSHPRCWMLVHNTNRVQ